MQAVPIVWRGLRQHGASDLYLAGLTAYDSHSGRYITQASPDSNPYRFNSNRPNSPDPATVTIAADSAPLFFGDYVLQTGEYLYSSGRQIVLGDFTDDVTGVGTVGQILLGFTGIDFVGDLRDIAANLINWEWNWGHYGQTALNVVSLLPIVGVFKYGDEVAALAKNADKLDEARDLARGVGNVAGGVDRRLADAVTQIDVLPSNRLVSQFDTLSDVQNVVPRKVFGNAIPNLSSAASVADRAGYSAAGRSLTKHGSGARTGNSLFPRAKGNPAQINAQAQAIVDDILDNPATTFSKGFRGRFGDTIEALSPDGRGIVYDINGKFLFFKE